MLQVLDVYSQTYLLKTEVELDVDGMLSDIIVRQTAYASRTVREYPILSPESGGNLNTIELRNANRTIGIREFNTWNTGLRLNVNVNVISGVEEPSLVFEVVKAENPWYVHSPFSLQYSKRTASCETYSAISIDV